MGKDQVPFLKQLFKEIEHRKYLKIIDFLNSKDVEASSLHFPQGPVLSKISKQLRQSSLP